MFWNDKLKGVITLKETTQIDDYISQIENIYHKLTEDSKKKAHKDLALYKYGRAGENQVLYELKNMFRPMYVIRDLNLIFNDFASQIDFIAVSTKYIYVIECKNLYGNITINEQGDFIRTIFKKDGYSKESLYSPYAQNKRHIDVLKELYSKKFGGMLSSNKLPSDRIKSIIVLGNPKTILNCNNAPDYLKDNVIKSDKLRIYVENLENKSLLSNLSDKKMFQIANSIMHLHTASIKDITSQYKCDKIDVIKQASTTTPMCKNCNIKLVTKKGKYGLFRACPNYPKCTYSEKYSR